MSAIDEVLEVGVDDYWAELSKDVIGRARAELLELRRKADLWDALASLPYGMNLEYSAITGKYHLQLLDNGFDLPGRLDVVVMAARRFVKRKEKARCTENG